MCMRNSPTDDEILRDFLQENQFEARSLFSKNEDLFFEWKDSFYQTIGRLELERRLWRFLKDSKAVGQINQTFQISSRKVEQLYEGLKLCHNKIVDSTNTPFIGFLGDRVLDLNTFEFEDSDPSVFCFFGLQIPSSYVEQASTCDTFHTYLESTLVKEISFEPDHDLISFVQEMFGYCLLNSIEAHVTFFLYGSGRNGKSVLLHILEKIIGPRFVSHMTIHSLSKNQFSLANLIGKKLNIAAEEESKNIKSDLFKSLVAGDPVTVEKKYQHPFEFTPSTKFVFATNRIPVFDSVDPAIKDRIYIIPFHRYFSLEHRDTRLQEKLEAELGGILYWALEGAKRLIKNRYQFSIPMCVKKMAEEFQQEQSSALTFVNENFEINGDHTNFVVKAQLYEEYSHWCDDTGRHRKTDSHFFKDLLAVFGTKINTDARKNNEDTQMRVVTGIRRLEDASTYVNEIIPRHFY